ncbi:MAG TPA: tripartite tricarboxylate transporter substrate binding protein [Pseudolabrys sp.]|nr:tripartite tricarboxylate transporter substrate binding protein [Pseudolabrys sp.]
MDRRRFLAGSAAAVALSAGPSLAQSKYPDHAITIINPFPPGGASEVVTRPLAAILEPMVKQPVVIETKAGAAGAVGTQVAASSKPDGYTLLSHITSISAHSEVDKLFGRPVKFTRADFVPLARFVADPCAILVNDQQPYKTLNELTEDAKARPDAIIYSSSGLYGALHIPMALYLKAANIKMRHLPTNGGGPALTALLGNNSQVLVSSVSASLAQIKAGKVRPLALFGARRSKALPDVPTMKESGFDLEYYLWVGMFAPKATPEPAVKYLREVLDKAAHTEQFKTALANLGQELDYMDQPEFAKFWDADAKRIEDAVQQIGRVQG